MKYHLAQLNIAYMKGEDINDPVMVDFVAQLDEVNALAEQSKGFVWRLKDDTGNATNLEDTGFDDPRIIVNMSTWESIEALEYFTYRTAHTAVMRDRKKWFEKMEKMHMVLWWVAMGHQPSVLEAKERLELLQKYGATPQAFTFRERFDAINS
ncbi:MAG: DUF3291 domain-containing protein [Bacteroidota bacterium]